MFHEESFVSSNVTAETSIRIPTALFQDTVTQADVSENEDRNIILFMKPIFDALLDALDEESK